MSLGQHVGGDAAGARAVEGPVRRSGAAGAAGVIGPRDVDLENNTHILLNASEAVDTTRHALITNIIA